MVKQNHIQIGWSEFKGGTYEVQVGGVKLHVIITCMHHALCHSSHDMGIPEMT